MTPELEAWVARRKAAQEAWRLRKAGYADLEVPHEQEIRAQDRRAVARQKLEQQKALTTVKL